MRVFECRDRDWLLSEEAFSIYSQCMYRATYDDYKTQMDDHLNAGSVKIFVCEYPDGETVRYNCVRNK